MKLLLLAVLLVFYSGVFFEAYALDKDTATLNTMTHGKGFVVTEVDCGPGGGGTGALTSTATQSALAVTFHNIDAAAGVDICPRPEGGCTLALGYELKAGESKTFEHGVRGHAFSCIGSGANVRVEVVVESLE